MLGTMACSFSLPDISNLPRMIVMSVAMAVAFAVRGIEVCRHRRRLHHDLSLFIPYLVFLLFSTASVFWAVNRGEVLYDTARWVLAGGLFILIADMYGRSPIRTLAMLSCAATVIILVSVGVAVWQTVQLGNTSWESRYAVTSLYTHKGTFALVMLLAVMPIAGRMTATGVPSSCRQQYGGRKRGQSSAGILPATDPKKKRGLWRKISLWLIVLVATATVLFLSTRTVLIAIAAAVTVYLAGLIPMKPVARRWRIPAVLVVALLMGVAAVGGSRLFCGLQLGDTPGARGGVLSSASIFERHALWNTTFRLVDRHPWVGVGAGNWKVCYPEVSTADIFTVDVLDFTFTRPHNDFIRVLSELGYVGLALLLIALAIPIVLAIGHTAGRSRRSRSTRIALAFTAAALVAALVDFPFDRTETLMWCTIAVALLAGNVAKTRAHKGEGLFYLCGALLMFGVASLSVVRMNSEKKYPAIMAANHSRMWNTMERTAREARSPLCSLTPVGTPLAYYEAMAREQSGKPALSNFADALQASPWHKQSLNDMARLYYTVTHDADSAEALFRKAIHVSPSFSYAYFNLAQLLLQEGKPEEAREVLLSLDLDRKQDCIDRLLWHYLSGENAIFYQHKLVAAERQMRDRMLSGIAGITPEREESVHK